MELSKTKIALLFLVITGGLFLFDYDQEIGLSFPGKNFLGNVVKTILSESSITPELLATTSLKEETLLVLDARETFFDPYLSIPKNTSATFKKIGNTSIIITEISGNAFTTIEALVAEVDPAYEFNRINPGTFYLNQIPQEDKTHNFLGIIIDQVLYGFQYKPLDHSKVLEIIDALSEIQ